MRRTISILLLFSASAGLAQRVFFEDPDLTFSFKKPKDWQVFDDGYVVKVSPSVQDSASTFITITYFEDAQPFGLFPYGPSEDSSEIHASSTFRVDGASALYSEQKEGGAIYGNYIFKKFSQRFEIKTVHPTDEPERHFRKIIRSIRISK